jgi:hypothetical protein
MVCHCTAEQTREKKPKNSKVEEKDHILGTPIVKKLDADHQSSIRVF